MGSCGNFALVLIVAKATLQEQTKGVSQRRQRLALANWQTSAAIAVGTGQQQKKMLHLLL